MARKGARFIKIWLAHYKGFTNEAGWYVFAIDIRNEYSVRLPKLMWMKYPDLVHVLNYKTMFYPLHYPDHIKLVFAEESTFQWSNEAFGYHTWGSRTFVEFFSNMTVGDALKSSSPFWKKVGYLLKEDFAKN